MQTDAAAAAYDPARQVMQADAPTAAFLPPWHATQAVEAGLAWKKPATHATQAEAPRNSVTVPAAQGVHELASAAA